MKGYEYFHKALNIKGKPLLKWKEKQNGTCILVASQEVTLIKDYMGT